MNHVIIDKLPQSNSPQQENPFIGPYRVIPGKLSVARTFGDIEAKLPDLGGLKGVVVCDPEVTQIKNASSDVDFIILGSDGIYDKLST